MITWRYRWMTFTYFELGLFMRQPTGGKLPPLKSAKEQLLVTDGPRRARSGVLHLVSQPLPPTSSPLNLGISHLQATQRPPAKAGGHRDPWTFPTPKMFGTKGGGCGRLSKQEPVAACRCSGGRNPRASALSWARRIFQTHSDPSP